jgi:hypothetical protein
MKGSSIDLPPKILNIMRSEDIPTCKQKIDERSVVMKNQVYIYNND